MQLLLTEKLENEVVDPRNKWIKEKGRAVTDSLFVRFVRLLRHRHAHMAVVIVDNLYMQIMKSHMHMRLHSNILMDSKEIHRNHAVLAKINSL